MKNSKLIQKVKLLSSLMGKTDTYEFILLRCETYNDRDIHIALWVHDENTLLRLGK